MKQFEVIDCNLIIILLLLFLDVSDHPIIGAKIHLEV